MEITAIPAAKFNLHVLSAFQVFYNLECSIKCPSEGFLQYFAMKDVTVAISGHEETLSQLRDLSIIWSCLVSYEIELTAIL